MLLMRLKSFIIHNYKSIVTSGPCSIDTDMTVLAGKNEAGKTAILEALRDFNPSVETFPAEARSIGDHPTPSVEVTFDIDRDTFREIVKVSGIPFSTSAEEYIYENGLTLLKHQRGKKCQYLIDDYLNAKIEESVHITARQKQRFVNETKKRMPEFVLFGDFSTTLPETISFSSADENAGVRSFVQQAGLDLQEFRRVSGDLKRRTSLLDRGEARINDDFTKYWEQVRIAANADGEQLVFLIQDLLNKDLFEPLQRSKGFQWFLSFYLEICKEENRIVLIDEPALYLHPKAQESVLALLQKVANKKVGDKEKGAQIIFSTHSPFLIDPEKLGRVKLVVKDENGTRIIEKFHYTSDADTLTPITQAIGLGPATGFSVVRKYNVVVEGISDYYYIETLRSILPRKFAEFSVIPLTGVDRIHHILPILYGWGLQFVVVLDNDAEGNKQREKAQEGLHLDDAQIIMIPMTSPDCDSTIEDMFTWDDFNRFILSPLSYRNEDRKTKNSRFLASKDRLKLRLARTLHANIHSQPSNIKFSPQTLDAFSELFSRISSYFRNEDRIAIDDPPAGMSAVR
jgi:predicted ATP-dependent endonuclease of OLD family